MVFTNGQMVECMKVTGLMADRMEKGIILIKKESEKEVFGKMVIGLNGMIRINLTYFL